MSGQGGPYGWNGGGAVPPSGVAGGQPGQIPALPPALIAAPPGVAGAPLQITPTPPTPLAATRARIRRPVDGLGPAYLGSPASVGLRLAAFTIDVVVVAVVVAVVLLTTQSPLLAALAAVEALVFLWVLEARTGITPGNAILRLRSARGDRPYSPGIGRQFVRGVITGAGFLVAIGGWVVVASSGSDRGGRRQSWADKAADTVVVAVPSKTRVAPHAVVVPDAAAEPLAPLAPPQVVPLSDRASLVDEDSEPTDAGAASQRASTDAALAAERPLFAAAPAAAAQPAAEAPSSETGSLLLIFDTGQRLQLALPLAANLGRAPVASAHDDALVVVTDPDASVSKTHLRLEHSRGRTWVTDFGSTNGSGIRSDDGHSTELVAGERVLLDDADRVRIGNRSFTFNLLLGSDSSAGERA